MKKLFILYNLKDSSALDYYHKSLFLYQGIGEIRSQLTVLSNIANLHFNNGGLDSAVIYTDQALFICGDNDWPSIKHDLYFLKFKCLKAQGNYLDAIDALHLNYTNVMLQQEAIWKKSLLEVETKFEVKQKDEKIRQQNTLLEQRKQLSQFYLGAVILLMITCILIIYFLRRLRKSNKRMQVLLKENEFLLGESNHRIKNNLQLINSILFQELQKHDDEVKIILQEALEKVESISTLHKHLYINKSKELIQLNDYLNDIKLNLNDFLKDKNVTANFSIEAIEIKINSAMYIGLLVTELIFNSLKHAFKNENKGLINLTISKKDNTLMLCYTDNGIGYSDSKTNPVLVELLCIQLKSEFNINSKERFELNLTTKI